MVYVHVHMYVCLYKRERLVQYINVSIAFKAIYTLFKII